MNEQPAPEPVDLIALFLESDSLGGFLDNLAYRAMDLLPAADGCGVTLQQLGRPVTVTSAGASAPHLDEAQYGKDDGPCLTAMRQGTEVSVADMLTERRWGSFPAYAAAHGTRSSLSVPVAAFTDTAGALNFYAPRPNAFAPLDLDPVRLLAAQATGAIALAQRATSSSTLATDLRDALRARAVVNQAIGGVMAQQHCSAEHAAQSLNATARQRDIGLRVLCAEIVRGFDDPTGDGH